MGARLLLLPLLLVLFFALGEPIQLIEQAYAKCCSYWVCGRWSGLVYGDLALNSPTGKITIGKESYTVDISPEVEESFKEAGLSHAFGFIVLTGFPQEGLPHKRIVVTAFVPAERDSHNNQKVSAERSVKMYNKMFVEEYKEYNRVKK
jgi:hypothetical protein